MARHIEWALGNKGPSTIINTSERTLGGFQRQGVWLTENQVVSQGNQEIRPQKGWKDRTGGLGVRGREREEAWLAFTSALMTSPSQRLY